MDEARRPTGPDLPVAADWFWLTWVTARTALITEPHVDEMLRSGIWYFRGRDRDLLVDTGNGVGALAPFLARLAHAGRPRHTVCVCTHAHIDHIGGFHEFGRRLLHSADRDLMEETYGGVALASALWSESLRARLAESGFVPPPLLIDAVPSPGFDPYTFRPGRAEPTHFVRGGDEIDLGGRRFTIVDLPGHTPGSIGLIDHEERALVSGDAVYDGGLIDTLPESDVGQYLGTMDLLRRLEVDVVYPGHGRPFDRSRLREIAEGYLRANGG
ncbi:MAG: MBL fold metallo-hydrolase [Actinobacteria bacterium]|nr:MBL fold metallo-hydrolase [Actinomycetota bacterium]